MLHSGRGAPRGRILVIEDDIALQLVVGRAASRVGFDTVQACDGSVALAHLESESFDLIILDIGLPGMDGRDVLQHVKTSPRTAHIPTFVYSGRCNQYDRETLFRLGAEDLIEKPFDVEALMRRVVRAVQKASTASSIQHHADR
jgi:DNA-binding response OmpR family regulator